MHKRVRLGAAGLGAVAFLCLPAAGNADRSRVAAVDVAIVHVGPDRAARYPVVDARPGASLMLAAARREAPRRQWGENAGAQRSAVGEVRNWLALDITVGYYRKEFTLRAVGAHSELWVASQANVPAPARGSAVGRSSGVAFLDGDCRNGPRTEITDAQVNQLVNEFETTMYPRESAAFSVPPARTGSRNLLTEIFGPAEAATYRPEGPGEHTIMLVDNVRDENFYDLNNANRHGYIAGFFSPALTEVFDRNIVTIDGFDWLHRTGASPPNEPIPGDFCRSAPARPYTYEATIAHEYQHLLMHYEDPDETNWINEGLADWAQTLTSYVDPRIPITDTGFDSHIQCFLGWLTVQTPANPNPLDRGGPENSLTLWGDQGDEEILCDYGAAYSMMEFVAGRYGQGFMTALHRGDANGLAALREALRGMGRSESPAQVVHDWSLMAAVDGLIDGGATIRGIAPARVSTPTMSATINWDNREAYATPGAPPNGSDYIRLRGAGGGALTGRRVTSVSFNGTTTHPPKPVAWRVDVAAPDRFGNPALYSGSADNRDEAIVRSVRVPAANPTLTFETRWNLEAGYDYAFVQVSTNRGASYRSLACTSMTTLTAPDALDVIKQNLPGYNGISFGWQTERCNLAPYAGRQVLLSFRAVNDPFIEGNPETTIPAGIWIDNVRVGTSVASNGSSLAGWRSATQVRALRVTSLTVRLLSVRTATKTITVRTVKLNKQFDGAVRRNLSSLVDQGADFVAAIVTYDEPNETIDDYARYQLVVNGVSQTRAR